MIFVCEQTGCHFVFESKEEPERCPECGGERVRRALPEEEQQFVAYRNNLVYVRDKISQKSFSPKI